MKRLTTVTVLLLLSLASVLPAQAATRPDPKAVNLTLSDMPSGFTLKSAVYRDNIQASKLNDLTIAQEVAQGRLLSYEAEFLGEALIGLADVDATTILYTTAKAAQLSNARAAAATSKEFAPMSIASVGLGSHAWKAVTKAKNYSVTTYVVLFARGRYIVNLSTSGISNTFTPDSLVHFGRAIDGRILRAR